MAVSDLEKSILKTCCFFDLFDYPLTAIELHKWLFNDEQKINQKISLLEIYNCLDESTFLKEKLASANGFYSLAGRQQIGATRLRRYLITHQKYRLAKKGLHLLAQLPFIRTIFLCNNFGYNNLHSGSDIDLFIIAAPRRLFLTRLLATLVIAYLGLRPNKQSQTDRLCLSFYASEEHLDFSGLKIADPDLYFDYWLSNLLPIFDDGIGAKLFSDNPWLKDVLPNFSPLMPTPRRTIKLGRFSRFAKLAAARLLGGRLGDLWESWAKKIQLNKISPAKKELAKTGDGRVIINDQIIKLHENDRRLKYLNLWREKINSLLSNVQT